MKIEGIQDGKLNKISFQSLNGTVEFDCKVEKKQSQATKRRHFFLHPTKLNSKRNKRKRSGGIPWRPFSFNRLGQYSSFYLTQFQPPFEKTEVN